MSDRLILAGVLQTILYLFFVRVIDLYEREPLPYVVAVFLWGFAVATPIAVFFNTLAKTTFASLVSEREANALTAIFVAPVVEESTKGLALLIIFVIAYLAALRRRGLVEFGGVMDGIVYGSAVGQIFALGFFGLVGGDFILVLIAVFIFFGARTEARMVRQRVLM